MSLFGSCEGPTWTFDGKGWNITVPHCVSGEDLFIPKFKGVQFEGDPTLYEADEESCIVTLPAPEDQFTTCELAPDGRKATLTIPGKDETVTLTVNAIDSAVMVSTDGEETPVPVVDCVLHIPKPEEICWGEDESNCPVVGIKHCQTGELLILDQVQSVTGNVVDASDPKNPVITAVASVTGEGVDNTDPQNPIINVPPVSAFEQDEVTGVITHTAGDGTVTTADTRTSTTVPEPDGFHTITTDDGVITAVCLTPVKSINGVDPDVNGNVNVADLLSTTTDNGDGTFTTVNADGTPITWSGDTFASGADNGDGTATITFSDGSTLTFCLNPVKSVVQNEDNLGATVTLADGTTGALTYPAPLQASVVDNADNTATVEIGGVSCDLSTLRWQAAECGVTATDTKTGNLVATIPVFEDMGVFWPTGLVFEGGQCPPVEPPCTEFNAIAIDPDGRPWEYVAGGDWNLRRVDEFRTDATANSATNTTAFLNGAAVGDTFDLEVCHPGVTNDYSCRSLTCQTRHRTSGGTYFGISPDWRIKEEMLISVDGGATYVLADQQYVDTRGLSANTVQSGLSSFVDNNSPVIAAGQVAPDVCTLVRLTVEVKGTSVVNANVSNTQAGVTCHAD